MSSKNVSAASLAIILGLGGCASQQEESGYDLLKRDYFYNKITEPLPPYSQNYRLPEKGDPTYISPKILVPRKMYIIINGSPIRNS